MSEEENRPRITAQDEAQDEVEGHGFRIQANDEGDTEDDDVEAHGSHKMTRPRET